MDVSSALPSVNLTVDAAISTSLLAFVDGEYAGECNDHSHGWTTTSWQCTLSLGAVDAGRRQVALLSVSLGIENGMDADEDPTVEHYKGVAVNANVRLGAIDLSSATWTLRPFLSGEYLDLPSAAGHASVPWSTEWQAATGKPITWYSAQFPAVELPSTGSGAGITFSVLIDMSGFTRGHAFVNGHDIGRYWLIDGSDGQPTQSLYHIPVDWLAADGAMNELTVLEELGSVDPSRVRLYVSQLQATTKEQRRASLTQQ